MAHMPKVSVIIPVYNVEKYLEECLDSVVGQTLEDIEIICVNDGSGDHSLEILQQYREKDNRIIIISKENAGYGHTMNCGLNRATGKYVAFLESDDYITSDAYEILYGEAEKVQADIIKGNYVEFWDENGNTQFRTKRLIEDKLKYSQIYDPKSNHWLFYVPMPNCLGLFRREFLEKYHVRHNETPGASHQDMGFWFQTFCLAKRIYFIDQAFYYYRQDNPNSSINDRKKIYSVHDEYMYIGSFLKSNPEIYTWCAPVYFHRMFGSYFFTYNKLVSYLKPLFLHEVFRVDFLNAKSADGYSEERFSSNEKRTLAQILDTPEVFLNKEGGKNLPGDLVNRLLVSQAALREYQRRASVVTTHCNLKKSTKTNTNTPCVSIIIPVYNTSLYLEECLNSILNQTLKNIEIICVDDGSTDDSLQILNAAAKQDERLLILSQPNMGQSAARNFALSYANGKYIYFMDSDDRLDINTLEYLYTESEKDCLDILYFDGISFFDNHELSKKFGQMKDTYSRPCEFGEVYTGIQLLNLFHENNTYRVSPCLQFIRKEYLDELSIRFYEGIIYEDNLFSLQIIIEAKRVSHRKRAFFSRRIRADSTVMQKKSFRHLYGYLICYIQMMDMWIKYSHLPNVEKGIHIEMKSIFNEVRRLYRLLDSNELNRISELNEVEGSFLKYIVHDINISEQKVYRAWIPRKIRGGIMCFKEHGLIYTLKRIWHKFTRLF